MRAIASDQGATALVDRRRQHGPILGRQRQRRFQRSVTALRDRHLHARQQPLERDNAVAHLRQVMGATDVAKAEVGTLRRLYGTSIERNAIHGSDSAENARIELGFFFPHADLVAAR